MGECVHALHTTAKDWVNQVEEADKERRALTVPAECLRDVFCVEDWLANASRLDAMDLADKILDHIFELLVALHDGAHAAQIFRIFHLFEQDNGVGLRDVIDVETFRSFGLDANIGWAHVQEFGDALAKFGGDGTDFWRGQDQRGVNIQNAITGVLNFFESQVEKDGGVGVFPAWIARRKEAADVSGGDGTKERVGYSVQQNVAVGVAGQALRMIDGKAADLERHTRFERV